jgi:two-component system, OmpR family, response regulator RegX3
MAHADLKDADNVTVECPVVPPSARLPGMRSRIKRARVYEKGRLRIDYGAYEVVVDGQPVHLSLREFELLCFFVATPNRVFDRTQIINLVWGRDTAIAPRTIDVHVRRLRVRLERDEAHPELIVTVHGVGYKFDERALDR